MKTLDNIRALAEEAKGSNDLMPLYQALWTLIATGSPADVTELLDDTQGQVWPDPRTWVYRSLCDYLPSAPNASMADVFLNHLKMLPWTAPTVLRGAEMLAISQPRATVEAWILQGLEQSPFPPVLGLLAHTLSLWSWQSEQTELGEQVRAALLLAGSPLAILPLTLHPAEASLPLRSYRYVLGALGGESMAGVGVPSHLASRSTSGMTAVQGQPQRLDDVLDMTLLLAPFDGWVTRSNGQVEAGAFWMAEPVTVLDASVIGSLPVASVTSAASVVCTAATPQNVLEQCFIAASGGGLYGGASYGALGRLSAWQALGALIGSTFTGDISAIIEFAAQCQFVFYIDSQSMFFDGVSEVAIVCLRPDRQTLVVLAAADTD